LVFTVYCRNSLSFLSKIEYVLVFVFFDTTFARYNRKCCLYFSLRIEKWIKNIKPKCLICCLFLSAVLLFVKSIKSIILEEYPISLSYHPTTFTILSITDVSCASNTHEFLFPISMKPLDPQCSHASSNAGQRI
jgi:hypothetical protein